MIFGKAVAEVPGWNNRRYRKLSAKVRRLDASMMLEYADIAGTGMARAFTDYRREGDPLSLDQIEDGLQSLWAITQEMRARHALGPLG